MTLFREAETLELLIIENDPTLRCLLRVLLAGTQFEVTTAETMKEVRQIVGEGASFGLVLCDTTLADSDLTETIPAVKELLPDVPLVAMTGWTDKAPTKLLKKQGASEVLLKGENDWYLTLIPTLERNMGLENVGKGNDSCM